MISVAEAVQIVTAQTRPLEPERIFLADALGRFLAEDIIADTDLPPFDRAQMDGYAVRAADVANTPARLRIAGESAAGFPYKEEVGGGRVPSAPLFVFQRPAAFSSSFHFTSATLAPGSDR